MLVGNDGYPIRNGGHCIAGGKRDGKFRASAIEFYGVKTEI